MTAPVFPLKSPPRKPLPCCYSRGSASLTLPPAQYLSELSEWIVLHVSVQLGIPAHHHVRLPHPVLHASTAAEAGAASASFTAGKPAVPTRNTPGTSATAQQFQADHFPRLHVPLLHPASQKALQPKKIRRGKERPPERPVNGEAGHGQGKEISIVDNEGFHGVEQAMVAVAGAMESQVTHKMGNRKEEAEGDEWYHGDLYASG